MPDLSNPVSVEQPKKSPLRRTKQTMSAIIMTFRDVAKKLLEAKQEREGEPSLPPARDEFDYPLIVNAYGATGWL